MTRSTLLPHPRVLLGAATLALLGACASGPEEGGTVASDLTDEERIKIHFDAAWRYLEMGETERATQQAEMGLKIDPDNERFMLIYGRGRLMRGTKDDIIEAIATFERIPEKDDWRVQSTWGAALERLGVLHEEAAREVESGERATEAADPVARAGELDEMAIEFWKEARVHFERAVELRSGVLEPMNGLMRVNALLGDLDDSIRWSFELLDALESSQRLNQDERDEPSLSAAKEEALFRAQRSLLDLEVKARLHVATLERKQGDREAAAEQLETILEIDPRKDVYHSLYAQVLFEMGRYERARESIDTFLARRAEKTTASFDSDPEVRRAIHLRNDCEEMIAKGSR